MSVVEFQGPGSSPARVPEGSDRVLICWTTKPQGEDRFGTRAFADEPAIAKARMFAGMNLNGSYGTHVSDGTKGRPQGRGGGAD
jgi:hypothetical protein